jgi:FMN phosphatase YigB (HAD superfamily)
MLLFIFDFDNTLGDTYGPYGEGNIFRTRTLPDVAQATEIYEKYRRWPDDIVEYSKLLEEYGITDPKEFFINAGMPNQLYDDVVPFFIKLREFGDTLKTTILTTGDEDFQNIKVTLTGVDKLVDEIFITRKRNKAENIREIIKKYQPKHTIFVDDHINITPADFDTPITIYDMDRAHKKEGEYVIHGLDELPLEKLLWTK